MAKKMIKDLKKEEIIDAVFIVKTRDKKVTRTGSEYVVLTLVDGSGEIEGRMWDSFADIYPLIVENAIVRVYADVSEFNSKLQLNIKKIKIAEANEYDLADLIPHTAKDINKMFADLLAIVDSFNDPDYKKLLQTFFTDAEFVAKFKKAPAAVNMHSACLGGLLEHTSNLLTLALFVCGEYPAINRDLLLSGVILHDIGKTSELEYARAFNYSTEGKLVGHIAQAFLMINKKIDSLGTFDNLKKIKLEHLILSHHGLPEFGAVKTPMTLEAVVLHQLDNLEAKITGFSEFVAKNPPDDKGWTPRSYMFDNRELFIG